MTQKEKAKIRSRINEARHLWQCHWYACGKVLEVIKHMLPNEEDHDFQVFMQTDGLCISDADAYNYPVWAVVDLYEEKGRRLTYDELNMAAI